jgi:hypothetical protein
LKETTLFLDDPWLSLAGITLVILLLYGELFFHELGHWFFARLLGYHIVGFSTGQGPLFREHLDPHRVYFRQFRLWPVGGYVLPVMLRGHESRLNHFLIYFAGPFFSLLFAIGTFTVLHNFPFSILPTPWNTVTQQVLQITLVLVVISVLFNAIPNPTLAHTNDGMGMLHALTGRNFPRPPFAESTARHSLLLDGRSGDPLISYQATAPGTKAILLQLYYCSLGNWLAAGDHLASGLSQKNLSLAERVTLLNAFSELALEHRVAHFAPRAIRALEEALKIIPQSQILRVRYAACLILESFFDDGRRELDSLEAETDNRHILACMLCVRAIADARQDHRDRAREHYKRAGKIWRNCDLDQVASLTIWGETDTAS